MKTYCLITKNTLSAFGSIPRMINYAACVSRIWYVVNIDWMLGLNMNCNVNWSLNWRIVTSHNSLQYTVDVKVMAWYFELISGPKNLLRLATSDQIASLFVSVSLFDRNRAIPTNRIFVNFIFAITFYKLFKHSNLVKFGQMRRTDRRTHSLETYLL